MAARKKGLSLDEKRSKMLELFYESKEFFQMKELEKVNDGMYSILNKFFRNFMSKMISFNFF